MQEFREYYDFEPLEITESKKSGILGVLKGNAFFEDRVSRNRRSYKDCWKPALSDSNTKRILADGLMFGTVGHDDKDLDGLVREGKVAIRSSKLKLNENGVGYGEFEIMDTPLGRFVHAAAKSGSKFAVSSKALGESLGKDDDGNERVDPKTFKLERFDIVIDPGFLDARPELREQLNEAFDAESQKIEISLNEVNSDISKRIINSDKKEKEENTMSNELLEKVLIEKSETEKELERTSKDLDVSEARVNVLEAEVKNKKMHKEDAELLKDELREYKAFFESVGQPDDIKEAMLVAKNTLTDYITLGSVSDITEALEHIKDLQEDLAEITEDGDISAITEALEYAKSIGERLKAHGGLEVMETSIEGAYMLIEDRNNGELAEDVAEISAKFGVDEDKIETMVESVGKNKTIDVLKDLQVSGNTGGSVKNFNETNDDGRTVGPLKKSRTSRLMESMTGRVKRD